MIRDTKIKKYRFGDYTGYVVAPWLPNVSHDKALIRHGASVEPWTDADVHIHKKSEEFYFLRAGKLWLLVKDTLIALEPGEFLQIRKNIPHAIVKGEGIIEHFVIRIPGCDDRKVIGQVPETISEIVLKKGCDIREDWGNCVSIKDETNRDCWLFGIGQAKFYAREMCLAYMSYPTEELAVEYGRSYHHCFHAHQKSWEFYTVLEGAKTLRVEDKYVTVHAGEVLEVPPNVKHMFHKLKAPFVGFTFRTPILDDKVEYQQPM
jgi:mannose-6-phosphate isomerase-like protein (cupin superfamily)